MKEYAKLFYSSKAWKDCRVAYFHKQNGLCENCLAKGIIKPGEIVHHLIHITPQNIENAHITLDHNNLQLLCRDCHADIHSRKTNSRVIIRSDGSIAPIS